MMIIMNTMKFMNMMIIRMKIAKNLTNIKTFWLEYTLFKHYYFSKDALIMTQYGYRNGYNQSVSHSQAVQQ